MINNYPKVLFLSALKPVDDSRMFEKLALSVSDLPVEIHVAGQQINAIPQTEPQIAFHTFLDNRRIATWQKTWKLIRQLKPQVVVACSPDLFLLAAWLKHKIGFRLVYDIQENYSLNHNFLYGNQNLKNKIAGHVFKQSVAIANRKADLTLLAEQVYKEQLKLPKHVLVLENKMSRWAFEKLNNEPEYLNPADKLELIFSGTISVAHGVFEAIDFAEACNQIHPTRLKIVGFASQKDERNKLRDYILNKPFVEVIGLEVLVPHQAVLEVVKQAHAGFMAYKPNAAFAGKTPTKFFEYLGLNKWILAIHADQFRLSKSNAIIHLEAGKKPSKELIVKLLTKPPRAEKEEFLFDSFGFRQTMSELIFSLPPQG